ncbi:hypothetical protein MCEMSEM23_01985 [Rhabdaerophilaceae bacterium]
MTCKDNPFEEIRRLFVDVAQKRAIQQGGRPARRTVFRKLHGVAQGELILEPSRSEALRKGIFSGSRYPCWTRFSSDVAPEQPDSENGTIGIGIKLFDVVGKTLGPHDPLAPTADIILQNHDVFFVDTAADMCGFTEAALKGGAAFQEWLLAHPETQPILDAMNKREESVLTATYWSVLPYAFGEHLAVKYRLRATGTAAGCVMGADPHRLATDLRHRLLADQAVLDFEVQVPLDGKLLPIDRATVRWQEADAPFIKVGQLVLKKQDIAAEGQPAYGEALAFTPWRTLPENQPLGSLAESRRLAYPSSANQRCKVNGQPVAEPHAPRDG